MPFTEYSAGRSIAGLDLEARAPNCGKRPFVGYIYGTCHATSDSGCAPPLEIQSWSFRDRKPSRAPEGHEIHLRRGEVTIVIFARSDRLAQMAVRALRPSTTPRGSDPTSCNPGVPNFHSGASFAGLPLVSKHAACSRGARYRGVVYGTCKADSETGCAPPLSMQTWPACLRSPADYRKGGKPYRPSRIMEIEGVPARLYGRGRLELSTGDLTVVIFGRSRRLILRAARALRQPLRPPVPGAQEGKLHCRRDHARPSAS